MPQLGLMNNPRRDPVEEVRWFGENGFDFVDFTLEFPRASKPNVEALKEELSKHDLGLIGHTDPNLPYAYPVKEVMSACLRELERCAEIFQALGARYMNIHPCYASPPCMRAHRVSHVVKALKKIESMAQDHGLALMLENFVHPFDSVETFQEIVEKVPGLQVHLDVGHAAIHQKQNLTGEFLQVFGERVVHMHLSDNRFRADDHMPLGAGETDWKEVLGQVKALGYDGTFTLEIFSKRREYQLLSRDLFWEWWKGE